MIALILLHVHPTEAFCYRRVERRDLSDPPRSLWLHILKGDWISATLHISALHSPPWERGVCLCSTHRHPSIAFFHLPLHLPSPPPLPSVRVMGLHPHKQDTPYKWDADGEKLFLPAKSYGGGIAKAQLWQRTTPSLVGVITPNSLWRTRRREERWVMGQRRNCVSAFLSLLKISGWFQTSIKHHMPNMCSFIYCTI